MSKRMCLWIISLPWFGACGGGFAPASMGDLPFNFHVLDEGRAYRSAQPLAENLVAVAELYGVRTVLNLRGEKPDQNWYHEELDTCRELNVTLVNCGISARRLPSPEELGAITDTLVTAEYPILIHCLNGADRTGMVAAVYRMLIRGDDRTTALTELSPRFFHFRLVTPCMDTLAEIYEPDPNWLDEYAERFAQLECSRSPFDTNNVQGPLEETE